MSRSWKWLAEFLIFLALCSEAKYPAQTTLSPNRYEKAMSQALGKIIAGGTNKASVDSAAAEMTPSRRLLLCYGLPGLVTAIPTIPVFTLLPGFYAQDLGLGLALTGWVLFLSRLLDVLSDPLVGWLADRNGGAGLRRLVRYGALLGAPALLLLLSPPAGAGALWLLLCSACLYLGWSLVQIPYLIWGARWSDSYHQRTRISAARETAVLIGIVLSGSLPALLGLLGFTDAASLSALAWLAIALGLPSFYLLLRYVPAPLARRPERADWRGIGQNRLFVRLLAAWFCNGLANGFPAVLFTFYCAHILQVEALTRNLLLALYFACAVLGMPLWLALSRRLSKPHAWGLAMGLTCPAFAAAFLAPGQVEAFALICVLTGLCLGADLVLPPAIQADVADWDRWRFRRQRTAGLFSLWNMAAKLALAAAAGIALPLLDGLGLGQQPPTALALSALALIYALLPCVLKLIALALVYGLPITPTRQRLIAERLRRRDLAYARS
jgi:GPH family glycoside/pentoside/hexuronide:cation symporter